MTLEFRSVTWVTQSFFRPQAASASPPTILILRHGRRIAAGEANLHAATGLLRWLRCAVSPCRIAIARVDEFGRIRVGHNPEWLLPSKHWPAVERTWPAVLRFTCR